MRGGSYGMRGDFGGGAPYGGGGGGGGVGGGAQGRQLYVANVCCPIIPAVRLIDCGSMLTFWCSFLIMLAGKI